jgi:hypothetical protein
LYSEAIAVCWMNGLALALALRLGFELRNKYNRVV